MANPPPSPAGQAPREPLPIIAPPPPATPVAQAQPEPLAIIVAQPPPAPVAQSPPEPLAIIIAQQELLSVEPLAVHPPEDDSDYEDEFGLRYTFSKVLTKQDLEKIDLPMDFIRSASIDVRTLLWIYAGMNQYSLIICRRQNGTFYLGNDGWSRICKQQYLRAGDKLFLCTTGGNAVRLLMRSREDLN